MGNHLDKPVLQKSTVRAGGAVGGGGRGGGLAFAASGMQGFRKEMEDAHTVLASLADDGLPDHSFVAVYDGHAGKQTSALAAEKLLGYIRKQPEFEQYRSAAAVGGGCSGGGQEKRLGAAMTAGFLEFDSDLQDMLRAAQGTTDSGSTAVAVFITPTHMVCANVGDSRAAYRTAGGRTTVPLSEDHKCSLPAEARRIVAAGGRVIGGRVDGSLAMSRALGDFEYKQDKSLPQCEQKVSPLPDIEICRRVDGADELLIVACDGVWDVLSRQA